jgi:hypothetical protein
MTVATITEGTSGSGTLYTGLLDCRIWQANPTTNYSSNSGLYASSFGSGDIYRSALAFPGLSNITGPVTVSAASLFIRCNAADNALNDFDIHRIKVANNITQMTWNEASTGVSWTTAGAYDATDIDMTPSASVSNVAVNTWVEFTGSGMVSLVEGWINGTISNYGVLLKRNAETFDSTSNEFASSQWGDPALAPYLVVTFTAGGGATISTITGTTVTEASSVVFTTTMSGTGGGTFAYSWSGTATSADYTATLTTGMCAVTGGSGSVTVSGSNITVDSTVTAFTVTVPTTTDTLDEANETIRLVIGGVTSSSGTITDDDAPPTITGTASSTVTAGSPVVITYSPGLSGQSRTYTLALTDGTAVGGTDYDNTTVTGDFAVTAGTGSVTYSAGTVTVDPGVTEFTLAITTTA